MAQRPLSEGEPQRDVLLLLAAHPHVPPPLVRLAPVDGEDGIIVPAAPVDPAVDVGLESAEVVLPVQLAHGRTARFGATGDGSGGPGFRCTRPGRAR